MKGLPKLPKGPAASEDGEPIKLVFRVAGGVLTVSMVLPRDNAEYELSFPYDEAIELAERVIREINEVRQKEADTGRPYQ